LKRRNMLLAGTASAAALGLAFVTRGRSVAEAPPNCQAFAVSHTEDEWRRMLTPAQYEVLRDHGTERPYSSLLDGEKRKGTFRCAGCGQDLFSSAAKFDSGTGWPSFTAPLAGAVGTSEDRSFFMVRTEVHCSRCGGHLGHVFEDGPPPTGLRYCMNGVAMTFTPAAGSVS
jgi:peptide-methionine (R)-S-oxide reductase